jgi:hypothetical protein
VRGESPEHHERRARLYAEAKEWNVVEVYRLDAMSGKTVKAYPETKRMLADIASGHITGLIFSKLARLARNTIELLEFADTFRDCGDPRETASTLAPPAHPYLILTGPLTAQLLSSLDSATASW